MSPLIAQNPNNRVILGLMTFGPDEETGARITDVAEFGKVLDIFQGRGYPEVDTARMYIGGKQEAFTRAVGWQKRGLTLATKVQYPRDHGDNTADKVVASVETSLTDLGTDKVDVSLVFVLCLHLLYPTPPADASTGSSSTCTPPTAAHPSPRRSRPSTSCTRPASSSTSASPTSPPSRWPRSS